MEHKSCLNCRFVINEPTHIPKCGRGNHPNPPFFSLTNIVINDFTFYCAAWEKHTQQQAKDLVQQFRQGSQPSDTVTSETELEKTERLLRQGGVIH